MEIREKQKLCTADLQIMGNVAVPSSRIIKVHTTDSLAANSVMTFHSPGLGCAPKLQSSVSKSVVRVGTSSYLLRSDRSGTPSSPQSGLSNWPRLPVSDRGPCHFTKQSPVHGNNVGGQNNGRSHLNIDMYRHTIRHPDIPTLP